MADNIFERAARNRTRFASSQGNINVEQLFQLPLTSRTGTSLDEIGIAIRKEIKDIGEGSLVNETPNARKVELELQLAIVKHIIEVKQTEAKEAANKVKKAEQIKQLTEVLERKQGAKFEAMSEPEILAMLKDLAG